MGVVVGHSSGFECWEMLEVVEHRSEFGCWMMLEVVGHIVAVVQRLQVFEAELAMLHGRWCFLPVVVLHLET